MCYLPYLYLLPRQLCVILRKFRWFIPSSLFGPQVMIIMIASSHPVFHPFTAIVPYKQKPQSKSQNQTSILPFPHANVTTRKFSYMDACSSKWENECFWDPNDLTWELPKHKFHKRRTLYYLFLKPWFTKHPQLPLVTEHLHKTSSQRLYYLWFQFCVQ